MKSKETSSCWLPTLQATLTTICVCSCKDDSSWVGTSMHAQMKHTLANLQELIPTLAGLIISSISSSNQPK